MRKIFVLFLSFTAAVVLLSITIVILAPICIAVTNRFPSLLSKIVGEGNPSREIIYIPPTQDDLDQIRKELEVSEVLPAINIATEYSDNPRSTSRIQSVISATESQLQQIERQWKSTKKDVDNLTAAYNSFLGRWEQDTSRYELHVVEGAAMQYFESRLTSLRTILGGERTSFLDLDRHDMTQLIKTAIDELHWLLEAEDESEAAHKTLLYQNANNMLLKLFAKSAPVNNETKHTCHTSYLDLNEGIPSIEFASASKTAKAYTTPSGITEETARKSDLYILMEEIKSSLSWRHDVENNMSSPSFISDEDLDDIRSTIAPIVTSIEKIRRSYIANEEKVRDYWVERFETFVADMESLDDFGHAQDSDGDEELLCSSSSLVEGMMEEGLEAFRRRADLRSELEKAALRAVQDATPDITDILRVELKKADVSELDYSSDRLGTLMPHLTTTSSWKGGMKSIANAVDGPWLRRGVVNWIDYFTDVVSGYNGKCLSAVSFPVASVQRLSLVVALQSIQIM